MNKFKKIISIILCSIILVNIFYVVNIYALDDGRSCVIQFSDATSINNNNEIRYIDNTDNSVMATIKVKKNDSYLNLTTDNSNIILDADSSILNDEYSVTLEVNINPLYQVKKGPDNVTSVYNLDGTNHSMPGDNEINLTYTGNILNFQIQFEKINNTGNDNQNGGLDYKLKAHFSGIDNGVEVNNGRVIAPTNWKSGNVYFTTDICTDSTTNKTVPNNGEYTCVSNSNQTIRLMMSYIINDGNGSVHFNSGTSNTDKEAIFSDKFENYGMASFQINSSLNINKIVRVEIKNYVGLKTESPYTMEFSLASTSANKVSLNSTNEGDVTIFYGNNSTSIYPDGDGVKQIVSIENFDSATNNADGSFTINLPKLSDEIVTKAIVKLKLFDDSIVTKTINIHRTAILLQHNYGAGDDTVYAGYIANKGYLYNNLEHHDYEINDDLFDAYLQIILYKDNDVVGYKQMKINDKDLIDSLEDNQSGSMEINSENQIPIYGKGTNDLIDGVNKVSVFLTNGPIKSNKLASIEYGIGDGVTLKWEELK